MWTTERLRWFLDRWVRADNGSRASQWLRDTVPATSRWLRHTLPAANDWWRQETLPAIAEWLRASIDRDRLRRRAAPALLVLAVAVVSVAVAGGTTPPRTEADLTDALARRAAATDDPARSADRGGSRPDSPTSSASTGPLTAAALAELASPTASPSATTDSSPTPSPTPVANREPERVAPVGGLSQAQMDHATTIVRVGQQMGLPKQAYVVALATALQESNLRNLANPVYPESYQHRNDGSGYDHDSVGLFQQRPSTGWGTVAQIMDPEYAARAFYQELRRVSGWENLPVTVAAQTVQVSAFPNHYAKHEPLARRLVEAIT